MAAFTASKYLDVREGDAGELDRALAACLAGLATLGTAGFTLEGCGAAAFGLGFGATLAGLEALGVGFAAGLGLAAGLAAGLGLAGVRDRFAGSSAAATVGVSAGSAVWLSAAGASSRCEVRDGLPRARGEAAGDAIAGVSEALAADSGAGTSAGAGADEELAAWPTPVPTCSNSPTSWRSLRVFTTPSKFVVSLFRAMATR